jgi:hypothetical protein
LRIKPTAILFKLASVASDSAVANLAKASFIEM